MSCKLLLNLVDCIRLRSEAENSTEGRELLMRMLEVFVLKFKTITKIQLPILTNKWFVFTEILRKHNNFINMSSKQQQQLQTNLQTPLQQGSEAVKVEDVKPNPAEVLENALATTTPGAAQKEEKTKFGFPQNNTYNVSDYRSLVKTLVCGVKTITWGCSACKSSSQAVVTTKQFQPHETLVFVRLVKWALKALDIYTLYVGPQTTGPQRVNQQNMRNKEEKEVLEHFSGVVSVFMLIMILFVMVLT